MLRVLLAWMLMAILAVGNGALREGLLTPRLGAPLAHVASTFLLLAFILCVCWASLPILDVQTAKDAWRIGLIWVALTLAFEFLAGHFVFGNPWAKILADYNILAGRIWTVIPLATLTGPRLALSFRRKVQNGA